MVSFWRINTESNCNKSLIPRADYAYIDFVLTTANTWKTLIGERPHSTNDGGETETNDVSFCWDRTGTKIDADHFLAHSVNLVLSKELRIGFFSVQPSRLF